MTKYENLERFKNWLDDNIKSPVYDLRAVLEDVELCHGSTGSNHYELSGFETKSGHAECYYFDYEITTDSEGDIIEEIYIF